MSSYCWSNVQSGDIVDIIAPGWGTETETVKAASQVVRSWQLQPRLPVDIFGRDTICSNTDDNRFDHLWKALSRRDSSLVWCLRGGYGSIRLLPRLARKKRLKNPKLLIGISDTTSLHVFLNQSWNWPSLHAPLLDRIATGPLTKKSVQTLKAVIFGRQRSLDFAGLRPLNSLAAQNRTIQASVLGGNLCVAHSTLGTAWQISGKNRILFFEDLGERGYRVDRMLTQLSQAGVFKGCRAVLFGEFLGGEESSGKKLWRDVIFRFAKEVNFPVLDRFPAGHGRRQEPLPLNTSAHLSLGSQGHMSIDTGICRGEF